jgi:hypothetical protein
MSKNNYASFLFSFAVTMLFDSASLLIQLCSGLNSGHIAQIP